MPAVSPIKRKDLIACLRALGFEPPVSGGDHQYMKGRGRKLRIPNPHTDDIGSRLAGAHPSAGRDRARGMGSALILFPALGSGSESAHFRYRGIPASKRHPGAKGYAGSWWARGEKTALTKSIAVRVAASASPSRTGTTIFTSEVSLR